MLKDDRTRACCLEDEARFRIQIAGERVTVPPSATINLEHERGATSEEIEFQLTWTLEEE